MNRLLYTSDWFHGVQTEEGVDCLRTYKINWIYVYLSLYVLISEYVNISVTNWITPTLIHKYSTVQTASSLRFVYTTHIWYYINEDFRALVALKKLLTCSVKAFFFSGLLKVIVRTPSLKVTRRCSYWLLSVVGNPHSGPPGATEESVRTRQVWHGGGDGW